MSHKNIGNPLTSAIALPIILSMPQGAAGGNQMTQHDWEREFQAEQDEDAGRLEFVATLIAYAGVVAVLGFGLWGIVRALGSI